jgi:hypothetical protein
MCDGFALIGKHLLTSDPVPALSVFIAATMDSNNNRLVVLEAGILPKLASLQTAQILISFAGGVPEEQEEQRVCVEQDDPAY